MTRENVIRSLIGLGVILVLFIGGMWRTGVVENPATTGDTMGTSYTVKIAEKVSQRKLSAIKQEIEQALAEVNRQMSTWDPKSEISRFNHSRSLDPVECSPAFASVTTEALALSAETAGAFDPTLQPLLNLWGFGSEGEDYNVPSDEDVSVIREITGWKKISAGDQWIQKSEPETSLALGAIAKGHGVDVLAAIMNERGFNNWYVEIGGELKVSGVNPDGAPWKLGVQWPTTNPLNQKVIGVVHLDGSAMATSGDYRNYIEEDGALFSHILDPRTGQAIKSDLASVTVIAPTCMEADGIATALFVMGAKDGLAWVEHRTGVEALFLTRAGNEEFTELFSSGFKEATRYDSRID